MSAMARSTASDRPSSANVRRGASSLIGSAKAIGACSVGSAGAVEVSFKCGPVAGRLRRCGATPARRVAWRHSARNGWGIRIKFVKVKFNAPLREFRLPAWNLADRSYIPASMRGEDVDMMGSTLRALGRPLMWATFGVVLVGLVGLPQPAKARV